MPRVDLSAQIPTVAGLTPSFTAASTSGSGGGFSYSNNGDQHLRIKNASGSPITGTIKLPYTTIQGATITEPTFTVAATTGDVILPRLNPSFYNQNDGKVYVELSAVTSVTGAVLQP